MTGSDYPVLQDYESLQGDLRLYRAARPAKIGHRQDPAPQRAEAVRVRALVPLAALRAVPLLSWRILSHEKGRTALATAGVFIAILLVFIELGFFIAVPQGGMLVYDHHAVRPAACARTNYAFQAATLAVSARAADRRGKGSRGGAGDAGLSSPAPNGRSRAAAARLDVFVIGFDPAARPFAVDDIERQSCRAGETGHGAGRRRDAPDLRADRRRHRAYCSTIAGR